MDRSKDAVAERLAEAHYTIEPGIELIIQLVGSPEEEADPKNPVKLLEVNPATPANGILPIFFGARPSGTFYPSVIIEVTPAEYEEIQRNPSSLPNGWRLGREFVKDRSTNPRTHVITLSHDEALVLSEFFWRFEETNEFVLRENAEFLAFSRISAQLDKLLVEPFDPNYADLVRAAQSRVSSGYEGRAPGVIDGGK